MSEAATVAMSEAATACCRGHAVLFQMDPDNPKLSFDSYEQENMLDSLWSKV